VTAVAPRRPLLAAVALFALYAFLPVQTHTYDSLTYVLDVQSGQWDRLFHPHHPLYSPLCWLAWKTVSVVSPAIHPLAVMRVLNSAAAAAAALCLFYCLLLLTDTYRNVLSCHPFDRRGPGGSCHDGTHQGSRSEAERPALVHPIVPPADCVRDGRIPLAAALTLLASLSYGPWRFATVTEPYAFHLLGLCGLVCAAAHLRRRPPSTGGAVFLAAIATLATLNLQSAALALPSALYLAWGQRPSGRRAMLIALATFVLAAGLCYLLCGLAATGGSPSDIPRWSARYALDRRWWNPALDKLPVALFAATDTFVGLAETPSVLATLAWTALVGLVVLAAQSLRPALQRSSPAVVAPALFLTLHTLFYYQLDAGSPCYWTPVPAVLALLAGPLLAPSEHPRLVTGILAILLLTAPATVLRDHILPESSVTAYRPYAVARALTTAVGSTGTLWVLGGGLDEMVFRVFTPMTVRSVHDGLLAERRGPLDERLAALRTRFAADLAAGPVFVYEDLYDGAPQAIEHVDGTMVDGNRVATIWAGHRLVPALGRPGAVALWRCRPSG